MPTILLEMTTMWVPCKVVQSASSAISEADGYGDGWMEGDCRRRKHEGCLRRGSTLQAVRSRVPLEPMGLKRRSSFSAVYCASHLNSLLRMVT
jgi:hypothetical protein